MPLGLTQLELKEMPDEANPVLGTRQCQLTQESIWANRSWGFATLDTNTEALGPHLLLLLPLCHRQQSKMG